MRDINEDDFTSLFLASDAASKGAQKKYIRLVFFDLLGMVVASAVAIYNYQCDSSKRAAYIVTGILMLISLILTIVLLARKFEDTWYLGRALAESCKTLTWRFMTCSELFESNLTLQQAEIKFVDKIKELKSEFNELTQELDADLLNKPIITPWMKTIRGSSLSDRKSYYIANRIDNQKRWYSAKAKYNQGQYTTWFWIIIISQFLSVCGIAYMTLVPDSNINMVGFLTTISASAIGWLQLKRHQELKQAYTTTSHELNIISSLAGQYNTDVSFAQFVLDSENAVSREHTLWLVQRRR